ncbi:MAG: ParB/RepB/Spo0J family partition protein [Nitrososphaera sp.]|uniref:ParB/RepB/Spo0J family partition protein n=1 Tax=Nitrososphaera sp. TaxID=1971748 RepID=UPI001792BD14|nr:ParB/RepB/Spo0J family partition protein [Nitrososphaera sp.]NWG37418.1 ParB/RepB/Spo0J family partition protein [Nitrososphaera sp.]
MEFPDTSIVEQIEMKMIRPSQFAVRDKNQKMGEIETLASSIREHGLLQPILIRPLDHGFEIVAGHRRYQACRSLRWRFIPCKIREMSDKQAYEIQLTENIQRKSMDPIEEAEAFRRYVMDFGWGGVSELAKKIGRSEEYVSHRLQLLKLPDSVKEQISQNRINVSQAMELTTMSSSRQGEVVSQIVNDNMTVREIREMKLAMAKMEHEESSYEPAGAPKPVRIAKKASLTLRVTLARIDNLIEEVHSTVEPEQRAELVGMLMSMRMQVHSMIDEAIRFKNASQKSAR